MLYNPFILKRENLLEKDAVKQKFDMSLLDEARELEQKLLALKERLVDDFHSILMYSNNHTILDAIRFLRNDKYNQFIERINKLDIDSDRINENMDDFRKTYGQYRQVIMDAEARFDDDLHKVRKRYQEILGNNDFLAKGIMMINPKVYYKLRSYLDTPVDEHRSKHRKLEGTLHNFLHRSAYKTSPFSNITSVGRIEFGDGNHTARAHRKTVSLNFTFIYHLIHYYTGRSRFFKETIEYTVPPFSITTKEGYHYIEFLAKNDSSQRSKVFLSDERLGKLRIPGPLVELFNRKTMITFSDLHHALGDGVQKDKVHQLIDKYTRIGLLEPAIGFDERSCDHLLQDVNIKLSGLLEQDKYNEMMNFIDECYRLSIRISSADDIEDMHRHFRKLGSVLSDINERTKIKFTPNEVFYEDGYFIDKETSSNIVDDHAVSLENIQLFSLIFDNSIRLRLEFTERLRQVTDNHTNLEMDSDFFSVLFDVSKAMIDYWTNPTYIADDTFQSDTLKELDQLKSSFINDLRTLCTNADTDSVNIRSLIDTYVSKISDDLKCGTDLSSSIFAQVYGDKLIVNSVYEGQEKYLARFMNIFNDFLENDHAYETFTKAFYDRHNYYDLTDTYGFNGNVKQQRLNRECYTSGIGTRRFTQETGDHIERLEDFTINTEGSQIEFMDPSGKVAKVCFRGSLTPVYMPGYIATVLQMFTSGAIYFNMSEMSTGDIVPRMTYDDVVLSRRRVRLSLIGKALKKKDGENAFNYFKRMNDIFTEMGLHKTFFLVIDQSIQYDNEEMYRFKPLYIDMNNPLSVKVFEKEVIHKFDSADFDLVFMEEYLGNEGPYVKEYQFEIYKAQTSAIPLITE